MNTKLVILTVLLSFSAWSQSFDKSAIEKYRLEQTIEFKDSLKSPLTDQDRKHFNGLDYFDPDAAFFVSARLVRSKDEKPFAMKTTTSRMPMYKKFGELHFEIEGKKLKLNVYQNLDLALRPGFKDYLFIPFSDLTSGDETYIGGRYLDAKIPEGEVMTLDFNLAYNPYCAYNPKFSCPITPLENDLSVAIRAGVRKFHD